MTWMPFEDFPIKFDQFLKAYENFHHGLLKFDRVLNGTVVE